ncbi:glycoside hydrolase family 38 C-terminal domain-containing protein [Nonomuraea sp. bgisy101]|uniref:glycoside hydrolase family 38 N-terminal domain-containing protein n=1 Tax=Nonomuraea sp. bgisy101 TaxID=3413784 RepID=UPI003D744B9C
MTLHIDSIQSTDLFVGSQEHPLQVLRVTVSGVRPGASVEISVRGGATGTLTAAGYSGPFEVPVECQEPEGAEIAVSVKVVAGDEHVSRDAVMTVAEAGWTMFMVSHFHYDPVWWNTQAGYTATWDQESRGDSQHTGFELVRAHLDLARRDADYCFVLAEVDYLKPYWDAYPEDRATIRALLAEGRLELMGGMYNEPSTNLTGAESTIRNAVYGIGFQKDVVGGDPATAWQLDAFGHDPQFPGLMAAAGLTSSSWARGPFHQWGPNMTLGSHEAPQAELDGMQFASEFDWVSPSGDALLTHYMAAHYSAGWWMDSCPTLEEAEAAVLRLFQQMKKVSATRNTLLPVGTDYTPPNKWATAIHRDWNARYVWPRFICALPRDFFAAVRAELEASGRRLSPQTRDMNPIYTGKDVSYIDTKLAQRATENKLVDAEKFATLACLLGDAAYPDAALDKAWRQLVYGAHHDAITGSESDQVYIDLLSGWREAWDLASAVHDRALEHLVGLVDTSGEGAAVTVFNPSSWARDDLVRFTVSAPFAGIVDEGGRSIPVVCEPDADQTVAVTFLAESVPALGCRTYRLTQDGEPSAWVPRQSTTIANEFCELRVSPASGGAVESLVELASGRQLIAPGGVGNEIVVYDEYSEHPVFREGPWHLLPTGHSVGSATRPADEVLVEDCAVGQRVTVRGSVGTVRFTQRLTLWRGLDRLDCETHLDDYTGSDELIRLRWPMPVEGGLPVSEVADAVIGRGFAHPDVDSAAQPWTLDNPAYQWFGLSSTARIRLLDDETLVGTRAIGIAEIVAADEAAATGLVRDLSVALVRSGVTSTCSVADGYRYGALSFDSNLPDVRISVGGPGTNSFTATVLAQADPAYAEELRRQLDTTGRALVWVPASKPLTEAWIPGADLTGTLDLPVLIIDGPDLPDAIAHVIAGLRDARVDVRQPAALSGNPAFEDRTVALLNRGIPGFAVDVSGRLHLSLMRSCTGWPSGVWIDPPKRTAPDGSGFQLQHWTHSFEYALVTGPGDWRHTGIVARAHDYNHPLTAVVSTGDHRGELAGTGSLLSVEPSTVVLTALKAAGNPLATGRAGGSDPASGIVARVYEAHGRDTELRIDLPVPVRSASRSDLNEAQGTDLGIEQGTSVSTTIGANAVETLLMVPSAAPAHSAHTSLGHATETVQPVCSRYWLHNKGPAPLGNQPVSVHLTATGNAALRVTVASDVMDRAVEARLRLIAPEGWQVDPSDRPCWLEPGGWTGIDITATPPKNDAGPGPHPIRALLAYDGQTYEDVVFVDGHGEPAPSNRDRLRIELNQDSLTLAAGGRASLSATLHNDASFEIRGECQAISPWGTWSAVTPAIQEFVIPPLGHSEVRIDVTAPGDARGGQWWLVLKTMWFGHVNYSPAAEIVIETKP